MATDGFDWEELPSLPVRIGNCSQPTVVGIATISSDVIDGINTPVAKSYATFENTSTTFIDRVERAGRILPAKEVANPMAAPHQSAPSKTGKLEKNAMGNGIPPNMRFTK